MAEQAQTPPIAEPTAALAQLVAQADDAEGLRRLRAAFTSAATPPFAELAAAAVYLIDRIADGSVTPTADATGLLREAQASFGESDESQRLALVERLDACAAGLGDVAPGGDPPATREPPLLTIREDGANVLPGTFGPAPKARLNDAIDQAPELAGVQAAVAALEAACKQLTAQVGTLELLAGEDLQRLASEIVATCSAIDSQQRTLAAWLSAQVGELEPGGNGKL